MYMQTLRSIAEIHETGVTAENFHEVSKHSHAPFICNVSLSLYLICFICIHFCLYFIDTFCSEEFFLITLIS